MIGASSEANGFDRQVLIDQLKGLDLLAQGHETGRRHDPAVLWLLSQQAKWVHDHSGDRPGLNAKVSLSGAGNDTPASNAQTALRRGHRHHHLPTDESAPLAEWR